MIAMLALVAAPATNDQQVVICAVRAIPAADLTRLKRGMVDTVLTPGKPSSATEALLKKAEANAARCNPGDNAKADARAAGLVVTSIAVEALAARLAATGVEIARVNARLRQTPPTVLDAFLAKQYGTPAVASFMEGVMASAGTKQSDSTVRRLLGGYTINAVRFAKLSATPARS